MLMNKDVSGLFLIDIQTKLTPHVQNAPLLIENCVWLMQLANALSVPAFLSEQYPSGLGPTIPELDSSKCSGTIIGKTDFSCMQSPAFLDQLKTYNIRQCILAGIETHVCIMQTALEMRETGLEVFIVVDAVSSRHDIDHIRALQRMKQANIQIVTSEMVFFEWLRHSRHPEFKQLSKQFLQ